MNKKLIIPLILILIITSMSVIAENYFENTGCGVYFTGIGCPHCARADPVLFKQTIQNQNVLIIEYEIYMKEDNSQLLMDYNQKYGIRLGVPQLVTNAKTFYTGDKDIVQECEKSCNAVLNIADETCLLKDSEVNIQNINFNELAGSPVIWYKDKALVKKNSNNPTENELLIQLLNANNIKLQEIITENNFTVKKGISLPLSGSSVQFNNLIELEGWSFVYERTDKSEIKENIFTSLFNSIKKIITNNNQNTEPQDLEKNVSIGKVISLAAVDAVNPCAIAVLTMILLSIITYNPKKKKLILLSGLSFVGAVIIMYLIYGIVIIKFFQLIQAITSVRIILYKVLGAVAIILGILQIKDFISYKAGSTGTEMPLSLRPKVKKLISKVTSPKGAFIVGLFVTLFLLPCTIGPYVIMGGILSAFEILKTFPLLLLYNIIFVIPMIAITFIVYFGVKRVEDVSSWKEKNIKILHLVSGIIIFLLGLGMLLGWV